MPKYRVPTLTPESHPAESTQYLPPPRCLSRSSLFHFTPLHSISSLLFYSSSTLRLSSSSLSPHIHTSPSPLLPSLALFSLCDSFATCLFSFVFSAFGDDEILHSLSYSRDGVADVTW